MEFAEQLKRHSIDWQSSILNAVKQMDARNTKLLVVLKEGKFESLLSIGDIQRAIIRGQDLKEPVQKILRDPSRQRVASAEDPRSEIEKSILQHRMEFMPVVDGEGRVVDLVFWENVFEGKDRIPRSDLRVPVVVMAGGKGTRLKPITNVIPKAMVPVDEKPIVEVIMDRFARIGARDFYMTVNYKAEMLESYFSHLQKEYRVDFLREEKFLGTAGSLHFLKEKLQQTFFVSNCDILIDENYEEIYRFHKQQGNEMTIVAALKHYPIPYGILETGEAGVLQKIVEKPELTYQVNSGMYIMEPELLHEIPQNEFFHITHLMEKVLERKGKIGVFPVSERSWMDIGEWSEYNKTRDLLTKRGMSF